MHLFTASPLHREAAIRLTISLDEDLYAAVKALARADDVSMSAALNRLLRRAIYPVGASLDAPSVRNGLFVIDGAARVSSDDVRRFDEEGP